MSSELIVFKGGSWSNTLLVVLSHNYGGTRSDNRFYYLGFRLIRRVYEI